MAKKAMFKLRACRVRQNRIVPVKGSESVEMTMDQLIEEVVTRQLGSAMDWRKKKLRQFQLTKIRLLTVGSYIGVMTSRKTGLPTTFFLKTSDGSNKIDWRLKEDALFPKRIIKMYVVEHVDWSGNALPPKEWVHK